MKRTVTGPSLPLDGFFGRLGKRDAEIDIRVGREATARLLDHVRIFGGTVVSRTLDLSARGGSAPRLRRCGAGSRTPARAGAC